MFWKRAAEAGYARLGERTHRAHRALVESPEDHLIVLLASGRARRAANAQRILELASAADPDKLVHEMIRQRVLPLLGARLLDCAPSAVSSGVAAEVHAVTARAVRQGTAHEMAMLHTLETLERRGLRCMPLKGQALSRALYGGPGFRTSTDIDLLVAPSDLRGAVEVLTSVGYRVFEDSRDQGGEWPRLHVGLRPPQGTGLPPVDVHWRLHWYEETFAPGMLDRSEIDRSGIRRAQPADELAALLLFTARDGFLGLRHAVDVAARWDDGEAPVTQDDLRSIMDDHQRLIAPLRAASKVCSALLGTPRLDWTDLPPPGRRERMAVRMADWPGRGDPDQISANVALIDALLSPPGTAQEFARRQLTAPRPNTSTAAHATKTVARFGAAAWRIRRGRAYVPNPLARLTR